MHPVVVDRIAGFTGGSPFRNGIDVACGTGQSATALKQICDHVTATDISREMLAQARTDTDISYLRCAAEQLPLAADVFDIMTVGLAFHWFDRDPFLKEAFRVLDAGGWLILYQNFFYGAMKDNPKFEDWMNTEYLSKYPVPPRDGSPFTAKDGEKYGFSFAAEENYTSDVDFTVLQLTNYLSTQTNMIEAIESKQISIQDALTWLEAQISNLFVGNSATFSFGGWIIYMRKEPRQHIHSVAR